MATKLEKSLSEAIVIERTYDAPANKVWEAITDKEKMKQWYFDIKEFKAEVGFRFQFVASDGKRDYVHLCAVQEVVPGKKLVYSWKYEHDPGVSVVTFELFPDGDDKTMLRLTHDGIGNFSKDHPELAKKNFEDGWNEIINKNLKAFVEN